MKIAIAQIKPFKGDIASNIFLHQKYIELAKDADLLIFPELSLTSYEPHLAETLALDADDLRLDIFQELSDRYNISIGLGVPLKRKQGISIAMLLFQPHQARQSYSKKHLHADEEPYFVCGNDAPVLKIGSKRVAIAICYEVFMPEHAQTAFANGAEIYLASVAKPARSIVKATERLSELARKQGVPVLMCNAIGYCDNFESAGQSSVWNAQGVLCAQLGAEEEGLLVFDTESPFGTKS